MLGENLIFSWKSRATQKREQEEYEKWAFPYGKLQRDNLTALLLSVFPRETIPSTLIPFLTCRELYESLLKSRGSRDAAIDHLINELKKYKKIIRKKEMTTYLALVLVNERVDETCAYPSADAVRARAEELEKLRRDQ